MATRGRKPKGEFVGKSSAFATRITPDLRKKLEKAAKENERSLSQEAEFRLAESFAGELDEDPHTGQTRALIGLLVESIAMIEQITGQRWQLNRFTHEQVLKTIVKILLHFEPRGKKSVPAGFPQALFPQGPRHEMRQYLLWTPDNFSHIVAEMIIMQVQLDARNLSGRRKKSFMEAARRLNHRLTHPVLFFRETAESAIPVRRSSR